jgi:hypothetical protein
MVVTDLCPGEVPEGGRLVPRNAAPAQQAPVVVPVAPHLQDRLLSSEKKCFRQCCVDLGCLSRLQIFFHPGSRIQQQREGRRKNELSHLLL